MQFNQGIACEVKREIIVNMCFSKAKNIQTDEVNYVLLQQHEIYLFPLTSTTTPRANPKLVAESILVKGSAALKKHRDNLENVHSYLPQLARIAEELFI